MVPLRVRTGVVWVLCAVLVAAIIGYVRAYLVRCVGFGPAAFSCARSVYLSEVMGEGPRFFIFTTHLTVFSIALLYYVGRAWRQTAHGKAQFVVVGLSGAALALLTTGRTAILLLFVAMAIYAAAFRLWKLRTIVLLCGGLFAVAFILVAVLLHKGGLGDPTKSFGLGEAVVNNVRTYFLSGPAGFQEVFENPGEFSERGVESYSFFYVFQVAKKLGLVRTAIRPELPFVFVPSPTNVFTFLRPLWLDFSYGAFGVIFVLGGLIGWLWRLARGGVPVAVLVYPFFLNGVLLQPFEEQIFANLSILVYLLVFYVLLRPLVSPLRAAPVWRPGGGNGEQKAATGQGVVS
jgi:oligosaccharide repeat unit polymerase